MFYEGDLQSGITTALQGGKLVACFVTNDNEESKLWESDFLQDEACKSGLEEQAVLLRLEADSTNAGFLTSFVPVPMYPALVIMKNGQLTEYLAAGTSKEGFSRRLGVVLASSAGTDATPSLQPPTPAPPAPPAAAVSATPEVSAIQTTASAGPSSTSTNRSNDATQSMLAERSARLEAHKKEQDAKRKAQRVKEAAERKKKLEEAAAPGKPPSADMKYALIQKKRQQEAREEKARILKLVEDDKAARRAKAEESRAKTKATTEADAPSSVARPNPKKISGQCALQIRLFDGSTIRSRFPSTATIAKDVRPWADDQQAGDQPYTFKQVLSPLPNKNIETSEEEKSLESLNLTPTATLILLPVSGSVSAYAPGTGLVSSATNLVSSGFGLAGRMLGSVLGSGAAAAPAQEASQAGTPASSTKSIRTLRDENKKDDQQFYNGNSLDFEPRRDDDDKED